MRAMTSSCIALLMVACGKPAEKPADATVGEAPAMAEEAPASISLADIAGTWKVTSRVKGSDAATVSYDMVTTSSREAWTIKFPNRDPIPVRVVAVEGDSIVSEAGPFESVLRKGVQVRTHVVSRLVDGKLVGTTTARYDVTGPDTVAQLEFEGTRVP